jgi:hypothetical protein
MEADTGPLLAKIQALEERFQKLASDCEQALNGLLQQQNHQETERESRLKELENSGGGSCPTCFCQDRKRRKIQGPDGEQTNKKDRKDPCGTDVLHLNVGGSKQIAVLRSTLTFVEGSMLAARFSGRWDDGLEKDRDGTVFIDQPADLFMPMIDFLQCKTKETQKHLSVSFPSVDDFGGSFDRFKKFANMVEYYGLTNAILPPTIRLLYASSPGDARISGHYVAAPTRIEVYFDLATRPWDPRRIQSFDVAIDDLGCLMIGWARHRKPEAFAYSEAFSGSITYCCLRDVLAYEHSEDPVTLERMETGMKVREGCVIRSERIGSKFIWTVDGKSFAHDPSSLLSDCASYVPFVAGGGKWWISNIEYEEVSA